MHIRCGTEEGNESRQLGGEKRPSMAIKRATSLTAVFVIVDELYQTDVALHKPVRPGPRPSLWDSKCSTDDNCSPIRTLRFPGTRIYTHTGIV